MYRLVRSLGVALVVLLAGGASAAPINTSVTLSIRFGATALSVSGGGFVDVTGNAVSIPAGIVALPATMTIPVTSTTSISLLTVPQLSNAAATFTLGGVTAQAPGEVCPVGGPAFGVACNVGGGVGGVMGLIGTINVHVIPNIVVFPVNFGTIQVGLGGTVTTPHVADAAAWTTATGLVQTTLGVVSTIGTAAPLALVSPTFLLINGTFPPGSPVTMSLTLSNVSLTVPEPAPLAALVTGALGLAVLAFRRPSRAPRGGRRRSAPTSGAGE